MSILVTYFENEILQEKLETISLGFMWRWLTIRRGRCHEGLEINLIWPLTYSQGNLSLGQERSAHITSWLTFRPDTTDGLEFFKTVSLGFRRFSFEVHTVGLSTCTDYERSKYTKATSSTFNLDITQYQRTNHKSLEGFSGGFHQLWPGLIVFNVNSILEVLQTWVMYLSKVQSLCMQKNTEEIQMNKPPRVRCL